MPSIDAPLGELSVKGPSGMTVAFETTWLDDAGAPLDLSGGVSAWLDDAKRLDDLDDFTGSTEYEALDVTGNVATLAVPISSSLDGSIRLTVDGVPFTVGRVWRQTRGGSIDNDQTIVVRDGGSVTVNTLGVVNVGGGGGGAVRIEDEGATVVAEATALNFVGAAVAATDAGSGEVTVTVTEPAAATEAARALAVEAALDARLDLVEPKLAFLTVTQPVDLDAIETRVNDLDAAVVLKGLWDASAGTFPGAGAAQAGWSYIVSVAGTVGGVAFAVNDRVIAITDNASTTVYASNWHKADYTDQVLSVDGLTGAVSLSGTYATIVALLDLAESLGYVEALKANREGDTFTGPVILDDDPVLALEAATKQYVDAEAARALAAEALLTPKTDVFKQAQAVNAQTGTSYTLVAGDAGKLVTLSNAAAITLTVPQDSDATIAVGTYIDLMQLGAGQVTVVAGTGATLRLSGLTAKARAQYSRLGVQKISASVWSLYGDLAAS